MTNDTNGTATYGGDGYVGRPWLYADTAADALRRLSQETDVSNMEGWEYPDDGYRVIGHLTTAVQRVPEVLASTEYLIAGAPHGAITAPGADDSRAEVTALYEEIFAAQAAAKETIAALGRVHARLGKLKYVNPEAADTASSAG